MKQHVRRNRGLDVSPKATSVTTGHTVESRTPQTPVVQKPARDGEHTGADASCCGRFQFSEGFLLDTITGDLWRFNAAVGALVEVRRLASGDEAQANSQIMENLQKAADAYAQMLAAVNILR